MSFLYDEDYRDEDTYAVFLEVLNMKNKSKLAEMYELTQMDKKKRLIYRYALACNGKEMTPHQLDQYLTAIEYALQNRNT